jgi:hypothetical protein
MIDDCPRLYRPDQVPIFDMRTTYTVTGSQANRFRVTVPDPRLWVKFGVLWVPKDGTTAPSATTLTLWIAAMERSSLGDQGPELPVEDLIGTSGSPLAIPVNTSLYGKFVQLQTGSTGLQAVMTVATPAAGVEGTWYAKVSYWPTVDMPREEWDSLKGRLGGVAADGVVKLQV